MFSPGINSLLEKGNIVISDFMCFLQEDLGDVFIVVYNQVYEELRIEEIDKEKIERKVKEEEELDEKNRAERMRKREENKEWRKN
jgi:hypothetical protein